VHDGSAGLADEKLAESAKLVERENAERGNGDKYERK